MTIETVSGSLKWALVTSCLVALALTLESETCSAITLIHDQHPAKFVANGAVGSNLPGPDLQQQIADDFVSPGDLRITQVSWTGFYNTDLDLGSFDDVAFTVRIYQGDSPGNVPDYSALSPTTSSMVGSISGAQVYEFSTNVTPPLMITGGQRYWIAVMDSDADTHVDFRWLVAASAYNNRFMWRYVDSGEWNGVADFQRWDFAFTIVGVPEPSSANLLFIAASVLGSVATRRR